MTCYVVKHKLPSHKQYKMWVMMGYTGSYEQYSSSVMKDIHSTMFICGDLGAHCTECLAPSDNLCDYPVGEGRTCDRPLCDEHSHEVAADVHYCRGHFIQWNEYLESERGYEVLRNVTPLMGLRPAPPSPTQDAGGSDA